MAGQCTRSQFIVEDKRKQHTCLYFLQPSVLSSHTTPPDVTTTFSHTYRLLAPLLHTFAAPELPHLLPELPTSLIPISKTTLLRQTHHPPNDLIMSGVRGLVPLLTMGGGIVGAGWLVSTYAQSKSIGLSIPDEKAQLRTMGAQGEARKAGLSEDDALNIKKVETHGGDKGFKVLDKDG